MSHAFERVVVQVHVRKFNFALLQRIGIDGEVVVVGGNLDLAEVKAASPDDCRRGVRT